MKNAIVPNVIIYCYFVEFTQLSQQKHTHTHIVSRMTEISKFFVKEIRCHIDKMTENKTKL